jgi:anaerobic ribonucleoside-triphosphate reductase
MENNKKTKCEIWSRVCGYLRPTANWNAGKEAEFKDRKEFNL